MILRHQRAIVCLCFILSDSAPTSTEYPLSSAASRSRYQTRVSTLSPTDVLDAASTSLTTSTTSTESLSAVATSRYRTRVSPISTAVGAIGQFIEYTSPASQQSTGVASNPSTDTDVDDKEDSTDAALLSTSSSTVATIRTTRYRSRVSTSTAGQSISTASEGLKSNTDGTTSTSSSNAARDSTEASTDAPRDAAPTDTNFLKVAVDAVAGQVPPVFYQAQQSEIGQFTEYVPPAGKGSTAIITDATSNPSTDATGTAAETSSKAHPVCDDYLGMENEDIPDERITASSEIVASYENGYAVEARLNGNSCWRAHLGSWIQADIGYQTYVSGVVTQGDGGLGGSSKQDWMETLKVSTFSNSTDDTEVFVRDESGAVMEFRANKDTDTAVNLLFPEPIYVQIVRITCLTVHRNGIQMRFEILGCKV